MGFQGSCSVLDLLNVGYNREIYLYTRHLGLWACRSRGVMGSNECVNGV